MYDIRADDPKLAASVRKKAACFNYNPESRTLYYVTRDGIMLRCLSPKEAEVVLKEAHDGTGGAHQPGPKLGFRMQRMGYYWPKMMSDAKDYAKKCHECQIHGNFKHQPVAHLASTEMTWHFESWGIGVMGPIHPPSSKGLRFILAITDYFSKWAEAIPLREVKATDVVKFIKHHVIYRYGVPRRIVHDNGPQFIGTTFSPFCNKFKIESISSTAYYPPGNGLAEAFDKTIAKLLKKFVSRSQRDLDEKLGECL